MVFAIKRHPRRGAILVLSALLMVFLLVMVAFALDTGYQLMTRTQIQGTVDSSALAAAGALVNGKTDAQAKAYSYLALNKVGNKTLTASDVTLEFGLWNNVTRAFAVSNTSTPNAVRLTATSTGHPTFFARVLGINNFTTKAKAVATYLPRDIVLALDYSGSMADDSQFGAMDKLGRSYIESNLKLMYQDLGSPNYGLMTIIPIRITGSDTFIKTTLGLRFITYPFPSGSWDDYINFVQSDKDLKDAGYKDYYGYLTFMDYLQTNLSYNDNPMLWKTHEQPITAVKDAVNLFLAYLQTGSTDDQVGFSLYTSSDNKAKLESGLTKDFTVINSLVRGRQAGHYVGGTNIYDGMKTARIELQNNARIGAKKMMVLMTDGQANMPTGNSTTDKNKAIAEANLCAAANIPIVAIALGAGADSDLMEQIGSITGGASFIIAGGQSVAAVQSQLEDIFKQVAADRPLKLVQ